MKTALLKSYIKMRIVSDDSGQDLVEYALIVALIALGATASVSTLAGQIGGAFTSVGTKLSSYTS
jgi:pilus assembly protein Flp/PilA